MEQPRILTVQGFRPIELFGPGKSILTSDDVDNSVHRNFVMDVVKRKFNNRVEKTNVKTIPGSEGVVEKHVTHLVPGAVKVDGKVWSAVCGEGDEIEKGATVVIKDVKGVTLTVEEKR